MDGVQSLKAAEPLRGDSLLFTTTSLGVSGAHFIDFEGIKGWVNLWATSISNDLLISIKISVKPNQYLTNTWISIYYLVIGFYYLITRFYWLRN